MAEYIQSEIQLVDVGDTISFINDINDISLKIAAKIMLNKLKECDLFCGKYDAKNGDPHYMNGISTVMEMIAHFAGDDDFEEMFLKNLIASEEKCEVDKE